MSNRNVVFSPCSRGNIKIGNSFVSSPVPRNVDTSLVRHTYSGGNGFTVGVGVTVSVRIMACMLITFM